MKPHEAPVETNILHDQLALVVQCAINAAGEGMPCTPGVLIITTVGGAWIVELVDPDRLRSLRVVGRTLDEALILADDLLRGLNPPWMTSSRQRRF